MKGQKRHVTPHSEETKKKISEKKFGDKHSEEHRRNRSIAITEWWRKRKGGVLL